MRTRHAIATSLVGLSLTAASVALPAPASATATTSCAGLVGCLLTTVNTTTGTLTTAVTGTLHTTVNTTVPTVVNTVLPAKPRKPEKPGRGPKPHKPHKPHKAHHGQSQHHTVRHAVSTPKTAASVKPVQPKLAQHAAPVIAPEPPRTVVQPRSPIVDVIQTVGNAVQTAISLFGWNLLALIPMAGIAFLISRRMGSSRRRSVSGLI